MKKLKDILSEDFQPGKVHDNPYATAFIKESDDREEEPEKRTLTDDDKRAFLEAVSKFNEYSETIKRSSDIKGVYEAIKTIVDVANDLTVNETEDWFDSVTVKRHMKRMQESFKVFEKAAKEANTLQQRLESSFDEIGEVLNKYYSINEGDVTMREERNVRLSNVYRSIAEQTQKDKDYQEFFMNALKKFGVDEPDKLPDDKKKEFYNYVDANWKADDETDIDEIIESLNETSDKDLKIHVKLLAAIRKDWGMSDLFYAVEDAVVADVGKQGIAKVLKNYDVYDDYKKYIGRMTEALKPSLKEGTYDIGTEGVKTGIRVYNRKQFDRNGQYVTVALINKKGDITYKDDRVPSSVKSAIEQIASRMKKNESKKASKKKSMNENFAMGMVSIPSLAVLSGTNITENFSDMDVVKIKNVIKKSKSLFDMKSALNSKGFKNVHVSTEPIPLVMIIKGNQKYAIANKKYVDDGDFEIGEYSGGIMENVVNESKKKINEASPQAQHIAQKTGTSSKAVDAFIKQHELDANKFASWISSGKQSDRMDFVAALVGDPKKNKKMVQKVINMESIDINEALASVDRNLILKRLKTSGLYALLGANNKTLNSEKSKFTRELVDALLKLYKKHSTLKVK